MKAPLRVPTSTRTPLMHSSFESISGKEWIVSNRSVSVTGDFGLNFRRQSGEFQVGPDFDRPLASSGNARGDADRRVEIRGLDEEIAAELLARFREGAVRHQPFAVADPDARRRRNGMQRRGTEILARRIEVVRELGRFREAVLAFVVGPRLLVTVDQQHVLHEISSFGESRWDYRVREPRRPSTPRRSGRSACRTAVKKRFWRAAS